MKKTVKESRKVLPSAAAFPAKTPALVASLPIHKNAQDFPPFYDRHFYEPLARPAQRSCFDTKPEEDSDTKFFNELKNICESNKGKVSDAEVRVRKLKIEIKNCKDDKKLYEKMMVALINEYEAVKMKAEILNENFQLFDFCDENEKGDQELEKIQKRMKICEERIQRLEDDIKEKMKELESIKEDIEKEIKTPSIEKVPHCDICMETYNTNDHWQACITSCGHMFGLACIQKSFESSPRCPKCNKNFNKENIITLF